MPGIPASLTDDHPLAARQARRARRRRSPASVWSLTTMSGLRLARRRAGAAARCAGCPRSRSRRPRPARRRPAATGRRGCRSGVPTRTSGISRRDLELVADGEAPAGERAGLGLEHRVATQHGAGHAVARQRTPCAPRAATGRSKATSIAKRMPKRVHRPGRPDEQRAVDAVAPEQALAARGPRVGHLERGQHLPSRSSQACEDDAQC